MKKILLIGEAMALFIAKEQGELKDVSEYNLRVAGAELNVAVGLSRLGYDVEYVTALGNEPLSDKIYSFIKSNNINTKYITRSNKYFVGMMLKSKEENKDPVVAYYRSNSAASHIGTSEIKQINISDYDLIHVTGISLCISESLKEAILLLVSKAKKLGKIVTFDPNLRLSMWRSLDYMRETVNNLSKEVDYILPGINEAKLLLNVETLDQIIDKYKAMGIKNIVIKNGEKGSLFVVDDKLYEQKGFVVDKVVDTVGAGDGFAVGIISGLLEKLSYNDILLRANAIGSIQVQHVSDNEGLPTREELVKYISDNMNKRCKD